MKCYYFIILVLIIIGCSEDKKSTTVDESFVSITYKPNTKLKDFPISKLVESLEIVSLDNRDEALVRPWTAVLSDNYVGLGQSYLESYKLFDKEGKFICNVGTPGEGPGEYQSIYSSFIDEKKKRIYLVTYAAKKILAYNLRGEFLPKECIPLAFDSPKSAFYLNSDKRQLIVLNLSFDDTQTPVCWVQDLKGNIIQSLFSESHQVIPDFSNELWSNHNTSNYDVQFCLFYKTRQDSLYHYNIEKNSLVPKFSITNPNLDLKHNFSYIELPQLYCTWVHIIQMGAYIDLDVKDSFYILVDKTTHEEQYVRFRNDYLGGIKIHFQQDKIMLRDGYLTMTVQPSTLKELFEERLQEPGVTDEDRKVIEKYNKQIFEDDNCIIMYGKLKQ